MTYPAGASHSLIGVYDAKLGRPIAEVLHVLGSRAAMVVNGSGLDELTVCGPSNVAELRDGTVREYTLEPEQLGLGQFEASSLAGGDPAENAVITREILAGRGSSAQRDVTALNAGAALFTAGAASTLLAGVQQALEVLTSGLGLARLEAYARFTQQH